jgi:HD superfamily phosphohydrolase
MADAFKRFKDPIHGYIDVPSVICKLLIDTPVFQRLRHIEQTSARMLFPSARHDRFSHSLGVFHLAQLACESIKINNPSFNAEESDQLELVSKTFKIAALMHDCAHAPFSHTFEEFYDEGYKAKDHYFNL